MSSHMQEEIYVFLDMKFAECIEEMPVSFLCFFWVGKSEYAANIKEI